MEETNTVIYIYIYLLVATYADMFCLVLIY